MTDDRRTDEPTTNDTLLRHVGRISFSLDDRRTPISVCVNTPGTVTRTGRIRNNTLCVCKLLCLFPLSRIELWWLKVICFHAISWQCVIDDAWDARPVGWYGLLLYYESVFLVIF